MIDPRLVDVFPKDHDGYPEEFEAEDTRDVLFSAAGTTARDFPSALWIEPREWPEVAEINDEFNLWPIDYLSRFTNQNPTHECTTHALRAVAEIAAARSRGIKVGPPTVSDVNIAACAKANAVWYSCLSIYAEANPQQRGGARLSTVLEIAVNRGFLPDETQPKNYNFKHSLIGTAGAGNAYQSHGKWVALDDFPDGWKDTAKHLRPLEIILPKTWEEAVCLVLHGRGVAVGRSGHSVPWCRWYPKEKIMGYADSYNVIRYDSLSTVKKAIAGAYCIWSMTTPADWEKPAG